MVGLGESITRVGARTWFAIAVLLTVVGYFGGEDALWSLLWLIPHAVILFGMWRGSRTAWAILVSVSVALAAALAVVGIGMQFGFGFVMNIYWWGPTAQRCCVSSLIEQAGGEQSQSSLKRSMTLCPNLNGHSTPLFECSRQAPGLGRD